jgi:hypothetical protein
MRSVGHISKDFIDRFSKVKVEGIEVGGVDALPNHSNWRFVGTELAKWFRALDEFRRRIRKIIKPRRSPSEHWF